MKTCNTCHLEKPLDAFETHMVKGRPYTRNKCRKCKDSGDYERSKTNGGYEARKKRNQKRRHDPTNRAKFIVSDSINADRARGLECDLDVPFVEDLIKDGCSYCGETEIKIGVDRIDNDLGHTKNNVRACCTRCNFIRRNMPYAVWLMLVPAIKEAREKGLLEGWSFGIKHHQL